MKLWLSIGWLLVAAVVVLSLIPQSPDFARGSDKVNHFVAYGSLMFWFGMLEARLARQAAWALGFVSLGIAIEFAQRMTGYRSFEVADMVADALGVLIGWVLVLSPARGLLDWVERRMKGAPPP